ncbi:MULTISPECIES: low affinity iron permease family protein [unclassified Sinorhizobium]|uniref:low affinity iron permease family protein n=1 Tax=unclassified Sinorhizobium TaxID=2613772 RepID=UPI0035233758
MTIHAHVFSRFASWVSEWAGKPAAFILALLSVIVWATTGPIFDYSETWQLVVNTGTTIITFLMVFILQNAQTRDTKAIQAKLNELILTSQAENRFIGIEHLDEEDLKHLDELVAKAARRKKADCRAVESENRDADSSSEAGATETARKPPDDRKRRQAARG